MLGVGSLLPSKKESPSNNAEEKAPQTKEEKASASGKSGGLVGWLAGDQTPEPVAVELPDFSKVDYSYDFTGVDYDAIPEGSERATSEERNDDDEWLVAEGYKVNGTFVAHGKQSIYADPTRSLKYRESWYLHGKPHGVTTSFAPNGDKIGELTHVEGKLHGITWLNYLSGGKKLIHPSLHGKQHGVWEDWYESGQMKKRMTCVDGKVEGVATKWHPNGQKASEWSVVHGTNHGPYREWFEDGELKAELAYKDGQEEGKRISKIEINGNRMVEFEGQYRDGKPTGKWRVGSDTLDEGYKVFTVDGGPWRKGTRSEFLAKLKISARDGGEIMGGFNRERGIPFVTGMRGPYAAIFHSDFGPPFSDTVHPSVALDDNHPQVQAMTRLYAYQCSDGPMMLKVLLPPAGQIAIWVDKELMGW